MKGNPRIVAHLQKLLSGKLVALDQFLLHARMYDDWGFSKLGARTEKALSEERRHTDLLMRRMLFLGSTPDMAQREVLQPGSTARDMLHHDLQLEYRLTEQLRTAIACCIEERDFQTHLVLGELLCDTEEDHTYWLEQQLGLIDALGIENYLGAQL